MWIMAEQVEAFAILFSQLQQLHNAMDLSIKLLGL